MKIIKEFKGSLNSIFNDDESITKLDDADKVSSSTVEVNLPLNCIKASEDQPRKIFNESSLLELAQSIKAKGVIQPILVRQAACGFYEIIVGERRFRAAKLAGLEKIPAIIRDDINKSDRKAYALIENIQRENLNPLEEAEAIQSLIEECRMTHTHVAQSIGRSRTTVSNLLRLLLLAEEVKASVRAGLLEMGHARALLSLTQARQIRVSELIIKKSLSVRATEKLVQSMHERKEKKKVTTIAPDFQKRAKSWQLNLMKQLSSKVNVFIDQTGTGKITIHFDSVEKAYWLIDHLKIEQ